MVPGRCRYCECTDDKGCDGGCSWTDAERTLCTACEFGEEIARLFFAAHERVAGARTMTTDELSSRWAGLPPSARQAYVMVTRHVLNVVRDSFLEEIGEEAAGATVEYARLVSYLQTHHSEAIAQAGDGATPVDVVLQILGERRIVLASTL